MAGGEQAMQLRFGFERPDAPVRLRARLEGHAVRGRVDGGHTHRALRHLVALGVGAAAGDDAVDGVEFAVRELPAVVGAGGVEVVAADETLRAIVALLERPPDEGRPAALDLSPAGRLTLEWRHDGQTLRDEMPDAAAAALLSCDIPFVASGPAWDRVRDRSVLPPLAARARVNLDGYVELAATRPQLVESAPLPGLFRIDETHFGLARAYAAAVDGVDDIVWDERPPAPPAPPAPVEPAVALSPHHRADLDAFVAALVADRTQVIAWEPGLGRRLFALVALDQLDAWPALVVCPPSALWAWQRQLDLVGRSHALTHDRADARVVAYPSLVAGGEGQSPRLDVAAVVVDEPLAATARRDEVRAALRRLGGLADAYTVGVSSSWPDDAAAAVEAMALLRPGEFRADVPLAQRYPVSPDARAREHVAAYLARRRDADGAPPSFRRSRVVAVPPPREQEDALTAAAADDGVRGVRQRLADVVEIASAGTPRRSGAKVAAAAQLAVEHRDAGRRVVVATRFERTASRLRVLLRNAGAVVADAATPRVADALADPAALVIVRFDRDLGDLRAADVVVVVDYPPSTLAIERAVGAAADPQGPELVVCVHLEGTVDDRLAILAARRRELASVLDADAALSDREAAYLLTGSASPPSTARPHAPGSSRISPTLTASASPVDSHDPSTRMRSA